jgi:hypothetical protein
MRRYVGHNEEIVSAFPRSLASSAALVMPAELQRIHQAVLDARVRESVTDEMRAVGETLWPDLAHKLPST